LKIVLSGNPKSTNHIYRASCRGSFPTTYLTPEGKAIKEAYQWEAKAQWHSKPLTCELEITVHLYFATKRYTDWDNAHKLWQDSLNGIVWKDDSQIVVAHVYKHYDKHKPRIEVDIGVVE
jgi:Holliday junction resolvase RusA-like endonuclease